MDAGFIWTEPHSKRLKVKLSIQKEVVGGAVLGAGADQLVAGYSYLIQLMPRLVWFISDMNLKLPEIRREWAIPHDLLQAILGGFFSVE